MDLIAIELPALGIALAGQTLELLEIAFGIAFARKAGKDVRLVSLPPAEQPDSTPRIARPCVADVNDARAQAPRPDS